MNEMTPAEISRRFSEMDRRMSSFVLKELYERDVANMRGDISEIKNSQQWAVRLIVGQFLILVLALLVFAAFGRLQVG